MIGTRVSIPATITLKKGCCFCVIASKDNEEAIFLSGVKENIRENGRKMLSGEELTFSDKLKEDTTLYLEGKDGNSVLIIYGE